MRCNTFFAGSSNSLQALTVSVTLATSLVACGGGGGSKDSGAPAAPQSADGRVSYMWAFEDGTSVGSTRQYFPTKDGVLSKVGVLTTCGGGAVNCSVVQEPNSKSGKGLHFQPTADSSFAWITGSTGVSLCSSDVLQFDPFGLADVQMTVAMWINPDQIRDLDTYHLFGTGNPIKKGLRSASFHLRIVDHVLTLSLYQGNGYNDDPDLTLESRTRFTVTGPGENWHHVAVTYNNFAVTMYIDGKVDATATRGTDRRAICEVHRPYYLGGLSSLVSIEGVREPSSYIFPGTIDQFVFSNRSYSADEIATLAGIK